MLQLLTTLQLSNQCQQYYSINNKKYISCSKVSQVSNTKINLEPQFDGMTQDNFITIFQYGRNFDKMQIQVTLSQSVQDFSFFGIVVGSKFVDSQFIFSTDTITNFYGLTQSISQVNTSFINSVFDFKVQSSTGNTFSLAETLNSNITMIFCKDKSQFVSSQSSMSSQLSNRLVIENSYFYQQFESTTSSAMFTLTIMTNSLLQVQNCLLRATISSNIIDNYAFVKTVQSNAQTIFRNLKGYVSGVYIQLYPNIGAENPMTWETLEIQINQESTTLIDDNTNVNNTQITLSSSQIDSEEDVQLFNQRSLYYGIHLIFNEELMISSNSFAVITQNITENTQISNLILDLDIYATSNQVSGIGFTSSVELLINNCTFNGSIENTGSIFLLFQQTQQQIQIDNLTTSIELSFGQASYGLIKEVQGGILINTINSNISMQISGSELIDSSLMFYSVSGGSQNQINNVTGIYSGYINGYICSSETCNVQSQDMNLLPRTIDNVSTTYDGYFSSDYYSYGYLYQIDYKYVGKCNGTKLIFKQNSNGSDSTLFFNGLGDTKVVQNTEIQVSFWNKYSSSYSTIENIIGGIAGESTQSSYKIINVTINMSFNCTGSQTTGEIGSLFGILSAPATIENVVSNCQFSEQEAVIGGLIGRLDGAEVTMNNITINGMYRTLQGACGGIIGIIESGSTTSLTNSTIYAQIYSMNQSTGPVYGENDGTISQLQLDEIELLDKSRFNQCPVGQGTNFEISNCPEKPNITEYNIASFPGEITIPENNYHPEFVSHYALGLQDTDNFNNVNISLIISDFCESSNTCPRENRSIFGIRASYQNLNIEVINQANLSMGSDTYGFSLIQSLIDDQTTSIQNLKVSGYATGRNYGSFGALAQWFSSNATVSNVTMDIQEIYFYYGSGFVAYMNFTNQQFENINVSVTPGGSTVLGLMYYAYTGIQQLTFTNSTVQCVSSASVGSLRLIGYYISCTSAQINFNTFNVTMHMSGSSSSSQYVINSINSTSLSFNNAIFNVSTNVSSTCSSVFSTNGVSGTTNFTNTQFTGKLRYASTSSYYSYDIATIEPEVEQGTRNIINVTIYNQTLIGKAGIAGMIAQVSDASTINIDNCSVTVSIDTYYPSSVTYIAGFIGYITTDSASIYISNSEYVNENEQVAASCAVGSNSQYKIPDDNLSNVICPEEIPIIQINSEPDFEFNYYDYYNNTHACYWQALDGSREVNDTTVIFDTPDTDSQYCGNEQDGSLLTLFAPTFTPQIIKNIIFKGTIYAQSYWGVGIALMAQNSQDGDTTITNVTLNQTNTEIYRADYHFNTYGFFFEVTNGSNVQFNQCINDQHHMHEECDSQSYAVGFVYQLKGNISLTDCVSNFTYTEFYGTTDYGSVIPYAVYYEKDDTGDCQVSNFTSSWSNGMCN